MRSNRRSERLFHILTGEGPKVCRVATAEGPLVMIRLVLRLFPGVFLTCRVVRALVCICLIQLMVSISFVVRTVISGHMRWFSGVGVTMFCVRVLLLALGPKMTARWSADVEVQLISRFELSHDTVGGSSGKCFERSR